MHILLDVDIASDDEGWWVMAIDQDHFDSRAGTDEHFTAETDETRIRQQKRFINCTGGADAAKDVAVVHGSFEPGPASMEKIDSVVPGEA